MSSTRPALRANPLPADADALDAVLGTPQPNQPPEGLEEFANRGAAAQRAIDEQTTERKPRSRKGGPASAQHRIGTLREPYERKADGARVRQWSLTLPVDVIRDMTVAATLQGTKPADLVLELCRKYLRAQAGLRAGLPGQR